MCKPSWPSGKPAIQLISHGIYTSDEFVDKAQGHTETRKEGLDQMKTNLADSKARTAKVQQGTPGILEQATKGKEESGPMAKSAEERKSANDNIKGEDRSVIEELKKLEHWPLQLFYLTKITTPDNHSYLPLFLTEVVEGDEEPENWQRGTILVPQFHRKEITQLPREALLETIGVDFTHRIAPDYEAWNQNIAGIGAPVRIDEEATYRSVYETEVSVRALNWNEIEPVSPLNRDVVVRRWIAQSIARYLKLTNLLGGLPDIGQFEEVSPLADWSEDAKWALKGLTKEKEAGIWGVNDIPGLCGEDDWYR